MSAPGDEAREHAWTAFAEACSDLLLHVARSLGGDQDAVMDRYLFVLQALRENGHHRLRAFAVDGHGEFAAWLVVVVRRLCYDHHRTRYGRPQSETDASVARQHERRQLVDLVGGELGLAQLEARPETAPDQVLGRRELRDALTAALSSLAPADRLLLRLRFEDGLSVPEIARVLGERSPFATYRRLDKVLKALRRTLNAAGVEDSRP
jgi:RNA polymerase sigma factor (sigma-70 family)